MYICMETAIDIDIDIVMLSLCIWEFPRISGLNVDPK